MEYVQASEEISGGARLSVTELEIDLGVLEGAFCILGGDVTFSKSLRSSPIATFTEVSSGQTVDPQ